MTKINRAYKKGERREGKKKRTRYGSASSGIRLSQGIRFKVRRSLKSEECWSAQPGTT
jgi:hypothetical protein